MAQTEVDWTDQQRINAFSKYNSRRLELEDEIKELEESLENYNDALAEIMMFDPDKGAILKVGDVLVKLTTEEAQASMEKETDIINGKIDEIKKELESIKKEMDKLKVLLYQKLGEDKINLET